MSDVPPEGAGGRPAETPGDSTDSVPGAIGDPGMPRVPGAPSESSEPSGTGVAGAPAAAASTGDPVAPAAAAAEEREEQLPHTPPWGSPPWTGGPAAPPPGPGAGWGPPPWATWYGWAPGGWQGAPGSTWQTPPPAPPRAPSRRPTPWAVVAAAAAVVALVALGVGIGYSVWGTPTSANSSTSKSAGHEPRAAAPFGGRTTHAFLGIELAPGALGTGSQGLPTTPARGAHVLRVVAGSPAARAGIVAGDTITSFGTQAVASGLTLAFDVQHDAPGQQVKVGWTASTGKHESATVKLGSRPGGRAVG